MKTQQDEPAFPKAGSVEHGLTKFEFIVIEMTKSVISTHGFIPNNEGRQQICSTGIELAKELIKQLNQIQNDTSGN